ncbi:hypothetical protein K7640_11990 [Micromonospora sp. PLK6-60]|uniref:hypothetical protein n=1 Tax=Micromonospora sp. PLK6-60 TaxID=2873383 RepID=UPI001CA63A0B|nr:hypothetical protein [Micromonospora sp. PLK6-60]MBY8872554.1 hypothetical protein [Micromonospora sp. PLK6-60]
MEFLLAFLVTGLAASGGWIAWAGVRGWGRYRDRRHELALARARAEADVRRAELAAHLREIELANETYLDFKERHPTDVERRHGDG